MGGGCVAIPSPEKSRPDKTVDPFRKRWSAHCAEAKVARPIASEASATRVMAHSNDTNTAYHRGYTKSKPIARRHLSKAFCANKVHKLPTKNYPIKTLIDHACSARGITLSAIAKRANVSRETLYRIMRGEGKGASVATLCNVSRALGLAPIVLLRAIYHDLDMGVPTLLPVSRKGDHISFIADATIPDGAMVLAGQKFVKTWVIQNTGSVTWVNRKLKCFDSELVAAKCVTRAGKRVLEEDVSPGLKPTKSLVLIPETASGESAKISVTFKAPLLPCDAISRWKMVDENDGLCFPEHTGLWCAVSVVSI
jgi:transcriptional regulator with XRE-family HTH domain